MSSILFMKFAIVMTLALFAIYWSSLAGGGAIPILLAVILGLASLASMRLADRVALTSNKMRLSALYSSALSDVREVKHLGNIDLLRTGSGFVAIAGLEVVDAWNVYEILSEKDVTNLSQLHGEALGGLSDCEAHIEISKTGKEPRIRYFVLARARTPEAARSKAVAAVSELSKSLSTLQIAVRPLICDRDECQITGLSRRNESSEVPTSPACFVLQAALATASLILSPISSPAVFYLTVAIAAPVLAAAVYGIRTSSKLKAGGPSAPPKDASIAYGSGRLRIGSRLYSFAALRFIEHYDRVMTSEDIARLVSELNNLFYSRHNYMLRISLRAYEEAAYRSKEGLKMDLAYLDFETGGGLSRKLKSQKHEIRLERIRVLGERPFEISGILILSSGANEEEAKVKEDSVASQMKLLGLRVTWIRSFSGILKALRFPYLGPSTALPVVEPPSVDVFTSLTMDFAWVSPIALDRSPLLAREGIYLGRDRRGRPVYWSPLMLRNSHMVILGPPGTGKSTIVRSIILRSHRYFHERHGYKPTVLIMDPAGEYREVARELGGKIVDLTQLKVNPLMLEGSTPHDRASTVVEMLRYAYALKGEEKVELKDAIIEAYRRRGVDPNDQSTWSLGRDREVTLSEVYKVILEKIRRAEEEKDPTLPALKSLADKLRDLCEGTRALDRTDISISDILRMGTLLCLSFKDVYGAMGLKLQQVVVWTILEQLRSRMLADQVHEELRVLVVIDEGHRFVQLAKMVEGGIEVSVEPPLSLHLRDVRKFGVGYIVVTHNPNDMPEGVIPLFGTTIAMSSSNVDYLDWAMRNLQLTPAQQNELGRAGLGRGYMLWMDDPRPLLVAFEPERRALIRDMMAERTRMLLGGQAAPTSPINRVPREEAAPALNSREQPPVKARLEIEAPRQLSEELVRQLVEEVVEGEAEQPHTSSLNEPSTAVEASVYNPVKRGICPKCHKRVPTWARVCSHCGQKFPEVET